MVASLPSPPSPVLQPRRLHLISGNSNRLSSPSSSAVCYFNICCRRSQILLQKSQKLTGFIKAHVQSPFQFWDYNRYGRSKNQINIRQGAVIWSSFSLQLRKLHSFSSQCWLLLVNYSYLKLGEYAISLLKLRTWQWKVKLGFSVLVTQLAVCIMVIASVSVPLTATPSWALTEENLLFLEAWRTIDRAYFDKTFNGQSWFRYREEALRNEPMNTREETYAAIRKMLATLNDPFTRFLEPEKFKSLRSGTQGALTGVGMSIGYPFGVVDESSSMGGLAVISSAPEGPANRAGIMSGDVILAIDGMSTESMGLYDAAERLQGAEGSVVELAIRSGPSEIRHISLKREKVTLNPVKSKLCEVSSFGNEPSTIGYIKLTTFNQNASGAVKEAIETLRRKNVKSFVLDLRNNSGGLFPEGIEIAKIWLQKGVIVYICDSRGVRDIYETDGSSAIAASEPLVVLVNKGTASASEILAGALKDNGRALLFGEPTYGKGKIQSVFELSDGSGLAVTVARYQTPALNDIDKVGVIPDHPLPKSFPMDEDGFCDCLKYPSSCNLNTTKLFLRVLLKERASRIPPESQSGYLEDLDQAPDEEIQELARMVDQSADFLSSFAFSVSECTPSFVSTPMDYEDVVYYVVVCYDAIPKKVALALMELRKRIPSS